MLPPLPGQRWISGSQPELGLGMVIAADGDRVDIAFPAAEELRQYVFSSAPLIRVRYKPGDRIKDQEHCEFTIDRVEERDGLFVYLCGEQEVPEEQLLDSMSFIKPEDRLLANQCDDLRAFRLRVEALHHNARLRQSPARGFCGARIDLIPHQLAIAAEACARPAPRLLLADEVGLGKTIEACLILHRLHLTGRADRVLVLVPEPLVHQWFVELLRRFNFLFALFDEERCTAIETGDPGSNPFLDSQLILCATGFLASDERRADQAREAGFDLLIVDEAHHLEWHPGAPSPAYSLVESLAASIPSLLLLTATPEQLGPEGHFARLRLLDPDRYSDLAHFQEEAEAYEPLADAVARLVEGGLPSDEDREHFSSHSPRAEQAAQALLAGREEARAELITDLIDSFGTGRVLFRNTRAQLSGFPERRALLAPLEPTGAPEEDEDGLETRVAWLADLLRTHPDQKLVLICHALEVAETIRELLRLEIEVETALFHEGLSLLQRDRNAAWFADPDGARLLICSEIGSEGRNFQFAHHLVLFDLPTDPELLEQRIGRLDRIGQTETIRIHVPYLKGRPDEILARWYAEGLDAFEHSLRGAATLSASLGKELSALREEPDAERLEAFLERSRALREDVGRELASGHDRLLEMSAPAPERTAALLECIGESDHDPAFERFTLRLFDHLGLTIEDLNLRSYVFKPGERLSEAFATFPEEGLSATFDRDAALAREDIAFMTPDHPIFRDAIGLLLSRELGNCTFAHWKAGGGKAVILEGHYVLECLAPGRLHADRFLPPVSFRAVIDHQGADLTDDPAFAAAEFEPGSPRKLISQDVFRREILPGLLDKAEQLVTPPSQKVIAEARTLAEKELSAGIERLEDLAQRNDHISTGEIDDLRHHRDEILAALGHSRLRLDAIRLVWKAPA